MPSFFQLHSFLKYWLDAVDDHSLHSPFLFDFYRNVIKAETHEEPFEAAERLRTELLKNETVIRVKDLGSGTNHIPNLERKVKDIARTSLSTKKFSRIYARIAESFHCRNIVELGTSLGINTLYLARQDTASVTTFEGSPEIAAIAADTFAFAGAKNIRIIEGNIDRTLPLYLMQSIKLDLVFMDANHRYDPTLKYFELLQPHLHFHSVIIMDDIHYNKGMENAWNEIRMNKFVYGSVDLFRAGILFFDPSLNKQHVVLQH